MAGLPPGQAEVAEPLPQPQIQLAQAEHGEVAGAARTEDLALEDDAAEVVGLGGPRRDELSGVVDEVEHVLGLPRGQCGQQRAPPGRDEQERAPRRRTQTVDQRGDVRQAGEVVAGDGGVDLHLQAKLCRGLPGVQRPAGGTFTVSNLGMYGIRQFTAVINPPQAAILAVGEAVHQPVVGGDQVTIATTTTVTLSIDHRAVDGATAARFLTDLRELIEQPLDIVL